MNEPDMANLSALNNPNRPPPPASESTSPFNFAPSFSVGPNSNFNRQDHSVHRTNINSFNEDDKTVRDSFNDNSLVDSTGKHAASESNRNQGLLDSRVPRKKKNSGVKPSPDPINRVDEEPPSEETDEQIQTAEESTVDSSGKEKKGKRWIFGRK